MKTICFIIACFVMTAADAQNPLSNDTNRNNIINKETEEVFEDLIDQAGKFITSVPALISEYRKKKKFEEENKNRCLDTLVCDLSEHAQQFAAAVKRSRMKRIAVMQYVDTITHYGPMMGDKMSTALRKAINDSLIDILERQHIAVIMKEHQLNDDALIEPETAIEMGHWLGADAIITGTVRVVNNMIYINSRMINVKTGVIIASEDEVLEMKEIYKTEQASYYSGSGQNTGSSAGLNSNERYLNESLPAYYKEKKMGRLKIVNTRAEDIIMRLDGPAYKKNMLLAKTEKYFNELPEGTYKYYIFENNKTIDDGEIYIPAGKTLEHTVK